MDYLLNKKIFLSFLTTFASLLSISASYAATNFVSHANLTYTITDITNLDRPGVLEDIENSPLFASPLFTLAGSPNSYMVITGNGSATVTPNGDVPLQFGSSFSFSANGNVEDGQVNSSQLGLFNLDFANETSDNYSIGVSLDYELSSTVVGNFADSSVLIDYYSSDSDNAFSGSSSIDASAVSQPSVTLSSSSGLYNFNLAPNATKSLYADVRITGNLEAASVPLPATLWFFLSGMLGISWIKKYKNAKMERSL